MSWMRKDVSCYRVPWISLGQAGLALHAGYTRGTLLVSITLGMYSLLYRIILQRSPRLHISCFVFALACCVLTSAVSAQEVTLRGFVADASNGQSLIGANIALLQGQALVRGGITNEQGVFNISRIVPGTYTVAVTYVGYTTHRDTLQLGDEAVVLINVALEPSAEAIDEVVITTEREAGAGTLEAGLQRIRPDDIQRIPTPAPSGDLVGYLQALPGVVSMGDRGGQLFVRGGTPSQNLILMDGALIYKPFHIIGFFSAFPEDLIANVDFYAGGFDARYSGRISSVIDVTMRGGNNQRAQGSVSLSPFLTGVRVEGPLKKGQNSFLAAVRTSLIEQTAPDLIGQELPLTFQDWFFKLQSVGNSSRCSGSFMHTYDRGRIDIESDDVFKWQNTVLAGQCAGFTPNSKVYSNVNMGFTYVNNAIGSADQPERSADAWRFNTDAHFTIYGDEREVSWGFFARTDNLTYTLAEQFQGLDNNEDFLIEVGGYVGSTWVVDEKLDIKPSLSFTIPFDHKAGLEPRLRLAWRPWGTVAQELNAAVGLYQQTFIGINDERDAGSVFTAWLAAPLDGAQARALHGILGWHQQFGAFKLSAEGYYKRLTNIPVPIWSAVARFTTRLTGASSNIYGVDTRLEFQQQQLYAYLGYGYSWIEYTSRQDHFALPGQSPLQTYHPPHDRRHQLNAVASWTPGHFEANVRWQFGAGLPYTQPLGFDSIMNVFTFLQYPTTNFGQPRVLFDKPYQGRLPTYHRLDVSMAYTFKTKRMDLELQAGGINLYDRDNLFYYDVFELRRVDQLPFTPYVSIKIETR